jgi:hypothetical protein
MVRSAAKPRVSNHGSPGSSFETPRDAIARAIPSDAAVFALMVDAKDDAAARFYRHHGFQAFSGRAARLFLPVPTARRVVENEVAALLRPAILFAAVLFRV